MLTWLSPEGQTITTDTVDEFCVISNLSRKSALRLKSGRRARMGGWCSTHKRVKTQRERFLRRLVNIQTGETCILGQSGKAFCRQHSLCFNELSKLLCGHKILYRGWCLEKSLKLAHGGSSNLAGSIFQKQATMPHPKFADVVVGL